MRLSNRHIAVAAVAAVAFSWCGTAGATPPPSAIAQYVEMIPTSTGQVVVGAAGHAKPLPKPVRQAITSAGGSDSGVLTAIASLPAYGATQQATPRVKKTAKTHPARGTTAPAAPSIPAITPRAAGAFTGNAGDRLKELALVLLGTLVGLGVARLRSA